MKNKKKQIEGEVKKTLELLDQIEEIKPNPYFYTRLQARLKKQEAERKGKTAGIFSWEKLRPAFLTVVVVINIISGILFIQENNSSAENRDKALDTIAKEYLMNQKDYIY